MAENFQFGQRQQQQPSQNLDMAQVLSARQFPIGDEPFSFGDTSFLDQASHDRPLLDNTEQNMLNSFWEHPDEFKDTLKPPTMPFGYMPSQDAADAVSLLSSQQVGPSHANSAAAASNYNGGADNGDNHSQQQYGGNVTGEDINAASLIHNIRNNSSSSHNGSSAFAMNNPGDFSTVGSWGSFLNPMTTDMSGHLENLTMTYTTSWQQGQHLSAHRQQPVGQPNVDMTAAILQANMQSRYASANNNLQYSHTWQGAGPATNQYPPAQGQVRLQPVSYGSDASFAGGRFQPSNVSADHDNKAGNLLGVPLAHQAAAKQGGGNFTATQQQVMPQGGQYGQNGVTWGGMSSAYGTSADGPPRKRRKSQVEGDANQPMVKQEESDEDYGEGASQHKRTKSMVGIQGVPAVYGVPVSGSPEGDEEARRRSLKKKENLTDQQKRYNHIQSEKKRRELINTGYNTLNQLVPALASGKSGLSRSEMLTEVNWYLQALQHGNATILEALGMPPDALDGVNRDSINPQAQQQRHQAQAQFQANPQMQSNGS